MDQTPSHKSQELGSGSSVDVDPGIKAVRCIFDILALAAAVAALMIFLFCAAFQHGVFRTVHSGDESVPDVISMERFGH